MKTLFLSLALVMCFALQGCQMFGEGKLKPNWPAACQQLKALDAAAKSFQLNHEPESKIALALGEWRGHLMGTITATCAIAGNPNAPDPAPLVWSSIDLGKAMIKKYVMDSDKAQMYLTAVAGAESALILFNVTPRKLE